MRIEELEAALERLDGEGRRPKFVYSVPTFQNPAGVTMSLRAAAAAGRAGPLARAARGRGQPLRAAALRRRAAAAALPARRRRLRPLHRHLLEDPLPRHPPRLGGGAAAGDGEGRARQAGRRPLHLDPDPVLRPRVLRRRALARVHREPGRDLPRADATRCSRRCARHFPPQATWTEPEGGLFIWATLPPYIDTGDLLAKALREDVAFVPGQAAYVDERGRNSMRLNFSAGSEDEIREGIRRIGKVIAEQVELYGALTGEQPGMPAAKREADGAKEPVERRCPFSPKTRRGKRREGRGAEGRAVARARRLAALRRRGSKTRWSGSGTRSLPLEADAELVKRLAAERPDVAFVAMHGLGGEDGTAQELLEILGIPFTGPGVAACARCIDKVAGQARAARGGRADAGLVRLQRDRLPRARRRRRARRPRGAARLPARGQAEPRRLGARREVRREPGRGARRRWSPPSATTTGCCSSASSRGASWRSACSAASRCRWSRRSRAAATATTSKPATRSAAPPSSARPS